ncbi:MAG: nicotinate-nucleotide--dimethylbenzimidazole phosphoribosyltransferase [Sciscionella sp.]
MRFDPVPPPSEVARNDATRRQESLTKPAGSLGRLEELGIWIAACQGQCPPRPFVRPRVVVFAGDHGVAASGVSAYPAEVTAQMVGNFLNGGAAVNVLADTVGATVRVADISVAVDTADAVSGHKIRAGSGSIDRADAQSDVEVLDAVAAGRDIADEEIDSGADLLIAGDMGIGNTTPAAVLISLLSGVEPVATIGRGTGIDDATWIRKASAVRDARRRAAQFAEDPVALLQIVGSPDFAAMTGFLLQAAVRKTPVILDGIVSGATALLAQRLDPGAGAWWAAGHQSAEPAHAIALQQLGLQPLLDLGLRLGEGSGALLALPLVRSAVKVLAEMATFTEMGVAGPVTARSSVPASSDAT